MHFDSSSVSVGAIAILESRTLYPKRGFQCLQLFLYNSGSENDQLNIYIREYSAGSVNGTLTLVEEIKGIVSMHVREAIFTLGAPAYVRVGAVGSLLVSLGFGPPWFMLE